MTGCEFLELVKEDLYEFSNKEWQRNTWTVFNSESFYDPVEQIADFLDGRAIEYYLSKPTNCLIEEEKNELINFVLLLKNYINKNRDKNGEIILDAEEAFNSNEWKIIRKEAKKLYSMIQRHLQIQ